MPHIVRGPKFGVQVKPYNPIPSPENALLYGKYQALAESTPAVYLVARLATHKYYNMDQVTAQALTLFDRLTGTGAKPLNGSARGSTRRTRSVGPVNAKLVAMKALADNGAAGKAAVPSASTELVGRE
jgi:hypothetical protein